MPQPVTIRNRNPGAMWPGKSSKKFGSKKSEKLNDGNKAATFPSHKQGAAALFDLLHRSYTGMTVRSAIKKWSGGNHVDSYLSVIERRTDFDATDILDKAHIEDSEIAVSLAMAMSRHESGKAYPMSQDEWYDAHDLFRRVSLSGERVKMLRHAPKDNLTLLEWTRSKLGEAEKPGKAANKFIIKCFKDVNRPEITRDETAWCAAFAGAGLKATGNHYLEKNLLAREYLDYGEKIQEPEQGALVIFWRTRRDHWHGHVAVVESWTDKTITYIGGNQSDTVSRLTAPRTGPKSKVLGYRRAIPAKASVGEVIGSDSVKFKTVSLLGVTIASLWKPVLWLGDQAANIFRIIGELFGALPNISNDVMGTTGAVKSLASSAGLPWPAQVALLLTLIALAYNLYDTWFRKRNRRARGQERGMDDPVLERAG